MTSKTYVIDVTRVRWAIAELSSRRIHPFFPAYLQLRRIGLQQGSVSNIRPAWGDLGTLLAVNGGPPEKPYYRPFSDREVHDPSRYWMNRNLAGSYAPSSIRGSVRRVVDVKGQTYELRDRHATLALETFLYGDRLSIIPLTVYLYRDFGFTSNPDYHPTIVDVVRIFMEEFKFSVDGAISSDFRILFDEVIPPESPDSWLVEHVES